MKANNHYHRFQRECEVVKCYRNRAGGRLDTKSTLFLFTVSCLMSRKTLINGLGTFDTHTPAEEGG